MLLQFKLNGPSTHITGAISLPLSNIRFSTFYGSELREHTNFLIQEKYHKITVQFLKWNICYFMMQ